MGVSSSFTAALGALKRNPALFAAAFFVTLVGTGQLVAQSGEAFGVSPVIWSVGSFIVQLVMLFFLGGAYGMAGEALDGETSLGTLISAGKKSYVSLLGATLLLGAIVFASFIAVGIFALVAFIGASASLGPGAVGGAFLAVGAVYLLGLLPIFFMQFYGVAVVVSGDSAVASLKRSYGVVRHNLLATLGFDAVVLALGLLSNVPTVLLFVTRFDELTTSAGGFSPVATLDGPALAGYVVSTLVLSTLFGAFFYTYEVAFYRDFADRPEETGDEPTTAGGDATAVGGDV